MKFLVRYFLVFCVVTQTCYGMSRFSKMVRSSYAYAGCAWKHVQKNAVPVYKKQLSKVQDVYKKHENTFSVVQILVSFALLTDERFIDFFHAHIPQLLVHMHNNTMCAAYESLLFDCAVVYGMPLLASANPFCGTWWDRWCAGLVRLRTAGKTSDYIHAYKVASCCKAYNDTMSVEMMHMLYTNQDQARVFLRTVMPEPLFAAMMQSMVCVEPYIIAAYCTQQKKLQQVVDAYIVKHYAECDPHIFNIVLAHDTYRATLLAQRIMGDVHKHIHTFFDPALYKRWLAYSKCVDCGAQHEPVTQTSGHFITNSAAVYNWARVATMHPTTVALSAVKAAPATIVDVVGGATPPDFLKHITERFEHDKKEFFTNNASWLVRFLENIHAHEREALVHNNAVLYHGMRSDQYMWLKLYTALYYQKYSQQPTRNFLIRFINEHGEYPVSRWLAMRTWSQRLLFTNIALFGNSTTINTFENTMAFFMRNMSEKKMSFSMQQLCQHLGVAYDPEYEGIVQELFEYFTALKKDNFGVMLQLVMPHSVLDTYAYSAGPSGWRVVPYIDGKKESRPSHIIAALQQKPYAISNNDLLQMCIQLTPDFFKNYHKIHVVEHTGLSQVSQSAWEERVYAVAQKIVKQ